MGVQGCVSGLSNVVPELLVATFEAVRSGTPERAAEASERLRRVASEADAIAFPLNVAAAMEARGLPVGVHKMPISLETRGRYEALTARLRALFREWNLDPA
jgi:dihydrodipicolinate synthase/N-acetylneuraminate lyase